MKNIVWLMLASLIGFMGSTGVFAQDAPSLFQDLPGKISLNTDNPPTVLRSRTAAIQFDALCHADGRPKTEAKQGEMLRLNLFDDVTFQAIRDRVEFNRSGSFSWIGHLQNVPLSEVILVVKDKIMAGRIAMPGGVYEIRYGGGDTHIIAALNQAAFPPDEALPEPIRQNTFQDVAPALDADDGSTIDVLVVYTQTARADAGGVTPMQTAIDLAISTANNGYANSQITQRLNLVHSAEILYTETGNLCGSSTSDLERLTGATDGFLDDVHTLRNMYRADEVVLIVASGKYPTICGCAWVMETVSNGFASSAFATVVDNCATGNLSLAHELGHTMGARHDWFVDPASSPYTYAHGYVNTTARWRTIMAYNDVCDCLDEVAPCPAYESRVTKGYPSCNRVNYWSNPNIFYEGDRLGIPEGQSKPADNHRTLNNTALTVANFRESTLICPAAVTVTSGVAYNGTTIGGPSNMSTYNCASGWDENGPEAWHTITTTATGDLTVTLTNLSAELDVFILSACSQDNCIDIGDDSVTYFNAPAGTYYIVVDGYEGASGSYTLTVTGATASNYLLWTK